MSMEGIASLWLLMAAVGGAIMPVALYGGKSQGRAICGAMLAVFLSPALNKQYLPDADLDLKAAVAFLVGCFGLNVTILAQKLLDQYGEAAASRFLGGIFKGADK